MGPSKEQQITNGKLTVSCKTAGAELTSILDASGTEYLWGAGTAWPRHAPVLFPVVGRLKEDSYSVEGRQYRMTQHGIARDQEFRLTESDEKKLVYELKDGEESKKTYPFAFSLRISYELEDYELTVGYEVSNPGKEKMYFSIGAHPGFRCPLLPGEKFTDYCLRFEKYSILQTVLHGGLRGKETRLVPLDEKKLQLSETLFDNDALVFENSQINEISLLSKKSGRGVSIVCEGWPYFGVWSKKSNTEFICLEPWYGVADHVDSNQQFTDKEGMIALDPGRTFSCSFIMRFH